jgi:molybdate transport system regulatory protein
VKPKLRVWVVFGSRLKFGDGRARLLELIQERGSLRRAAAEFDMSYRNAWGYLRELETAAGFKLVTRGPAGTLRSGMRLTPQGQEFLACYRKFQQRLDAEAVRTFEASFGGTTFAGRGATPPGDRAGAAPGRPPKRRTAAPRPSGRSAGS